MNNTAEDSTILLTPHLASLSRHANAQSAAAESSSGRTLSDSQDNYIVSLIKMRAVVDPRLPKSIADKINQQFIIDRIIDTAKKLATAGQVIMRVLENNCTVIKLTNMQYLQKMTGNTAAGCFTPLELCIYLTDDQYYLTPELISHEFRHADIYLRHKDINADQTIGSLPVIFTPPEKFSSALDKGDERIREFKQLWTMSKSGKQLTIHQQNVFEQYTLASQDCLLPYIEEKIPLHLKKQVVLQGFQVGRTVKRNFMEMKVVRMTEENNILIIGMIPTDPVVGIINLVEFTNVKLSNTMYLNKSWLVKLFERDATIFERLSQNAIDMFYPEAQLLIEQDMQQCLLHQQATNTDIDKKKPGCGWVSLTIFSNLKHSKPESEIFSSQREINHQIRHSITTMR